MVQALRDLLEDAYCDEASLTEALFSFTCIHSGEEADDVISFLRESAIPFEKEGTTRTYLILNDAEWDEGRVQIDGYFSIAIKNIYFNNTEADILQNIFGNPTQKNYPAFLIGQLARGALAPKGAGAAYLDIALSYISTVSNIIGGKFVYLDCVPARQSYYEAHGFSFLQNKHKSNLIQMYRIL